MPEYVIGWTCGECGSEGEVRGKNVHEAWEKFEVIEKGHKDHNPFLRTEVEVDEEDED